MYVTSKICPSHLWGPCFSIFPTPTSVTSEIKLWVSAGGSLMTVSFPSTPNLGALEAKSNCFLWDSKMIFTAAKCNNWFHKLVMRPLRPLFIIPAVSVLPFLIIIWQLLSLGHARKDKIDRYAMMDIRLSSDIKAPRLVEEMRCVCQKKCDSDVWWQLHKPVSGVQPVYV